MTDHDKLVGELRRLSPAVQKWSDRAWCEESVQASRRDPSSLGHPPSWLGGPVRRQQLRERFDDAKILVCCRRQKGGIPKPERHDDDERKDKRGGLERPASGPPCEENCLSLHVW